MPAGVFIPVKKEGKVEQAQKMSTSIKKQYKFTEAVFANRVKGISGQSNDLQMKYAELTAKTSKRIAAVCAAPRVCCAHSCAHAYVLHPARNSQEGPSLAWSIWSLEPSSESTKLTSMINHYSLN